MASRQKKQQAPQPQTGSGGLESPAPPSPSPNARIAAKLAIFALISIIFLMAVFPQRVNDTWTHLSIGRYIYEHRTVPSTEVFLYPIEGAEVSYSEWLFGLMLYGVYSLGGGINATILFKAAVIALTFYIFWLTARLRGTSPWAYIPIALTTAIVIRFRFLERPEIMTYLFLGVSLYLFELYRLRRSRLIYLIPLLQIVWANMHPACTLGIFIAGVYFGSILLAEFIASHRLKSGRMRWLSVKTTGIIFVLTIIATLVTPFPLEPFRMTFEIMAVKDLKTVVDETNPISNYPMFLKEFLTMCTAWLVLTAIRLYRRQFPSMEDIILFAVFATLPIQSVKGLSIFMLFAMVQTGQGASLFLSGIKNQWRPLAYAAIMAPLVIIIFIDEPPKDVKLGLGVSPGHYPDGAVHFVARLGLSGNIYNLFETGGYLSFNLHPRQKIFIDDRLTSKPAVWNNAINYGDVLEAHEGWENILDSNNVSTIMANCCYTGNAMTFPLIEMLYDSPDWALIYAAEDSFVFVKNTPAMNPVIRQYGLPKTEIYASIIKWAHLMADNPESSYLPLTLGKAYIRLNRPQEAKAALQQWLKIAPGDEKVHEVVQQLTEAGY